MSNLRQARQAASLLAIALCFGVPICFAATATGEVDATPAALGKQPTETVLSAFETGAAPFVTFEFAITSVAPTKEPAVSQQRLSEPFGQETSALVEGRVQSKWNAVKARLRVESAILQKCRTDKNSCPPAAGRFLAVVDKAMSRNGWARIAEINRTINLNIRPVDDRTQYGVVDLWATPLMTFQANAGDCEDYAIAKYAALREIGTPERDLRIVIVHDRAGNEDHAVAAVRHEGHWLILDNRTLEMRQDKNIAEFDPLFLIDNEGVKRAAKPALRPSKSTASVGPSGASLQSSPG